MPLRLWLMMTALLTLVALSACSAPEDPVTRTARQIMESDGLGNAAITQVIEGDPAVRNADELYCVATDANSPTGQLPYLLVIWRTGDEWQGAQLLEGYYEWDLQGCPR